jgi:GNAT superfamily N-acetyltransferase
MQVKDPDSAFDAPLDILVDPNLPAVEQMRKLTSGHMFAMHDRMNRGRVLFACTFAVAPTAQGRGVGSALLRWATGLADAHGASAWVHLSDNPGGARALEKSGFREVNRLAFDLDHYATKPKPGGGKWGVYTFRYFHREVQAPE